VDITDESWVDVIDLITSIEITEEARSVLPLVTRYSVATGFHETPCSPALSATDFSGVSSGGHQRLGVLTGLAVQMPRQKSGSGLITGVNECPRRSKNRL